MCRINVCELFRHGALLHRGFFYYFQVNVEITGKNGKFLFFPS